MLLRARHLHHGLLPMLDVVLEQPLGERFCDARTQKILMTAFLQGKSSNPSFFICHLAFGMRCLRLGKPIKNEAPPIPALYMAMNEVIATQAEKISDSQPFTPPP